MTAFEFMTSHVIFKLHYNQIYQLKTTNVLQEKSEILYPLILLVRLFPLFEQANQPIVI